MSRRASSTSDDGSPPADTALLAQKAPTYAAFSPASTSGYSASAKQRSTVIVHKKSPLLIATPPQITRSLAHSHVYLLPLNKFVGLLSWSTDDQWESFLLLSAFWGITMYGSIILRYGGPVILVAFLILGMYSRRYSPLSSTVKTGQKQSSDTSTQQHKSLDEIVDSLQQFTARCNILLEPFLSLTDFLSTQTTPTSATTRPALTTLFVRILLITPIWIILTLPPLRILTARRIILLAGTLMLTWHSRPAKITRVILWRSVFLRRLFGLATGLSFTPPSEDHHLLAYQPHRKSQTLVASNIAAQNRSPGVRFTFILYENERRWIGLGWTKSLFSGERAPWTDEHLNPASSKDEFELPQVTGGIARWRWLEGSSWKIDKGHFAPDHKRTPSSKTPTAKNDGGEKTDDGGWIYYDNKWDTGRREDGWGRYCRRRKWYRDAELVEINPDSSTSPMKRVISEDESPESKIRRAKEYARNLGSGELAEDSMHSSVATLRPPSTPSRTRSATTTPTISSLTYSQSPATSSQTKNSEEGIATGRDKDDASGRRRWFNRHRSGSKSSSSKNTVFSDASTGRDSKEDDIVDRWRDVDREGQSRWAEDLDMSLS